ncbi:P-loop containing nucleoside triphosphate hydrolase protein [Amylocystis lapponica]|nr:P-loop containing nucleoside triphosphate hydrolase protein [Amylocystis lapponica]
MLETTTPRSATDPGDGTGWFKTRYSVKQRAMLDLINRMHNTGVQQYIDIPMIAVVGQQSAGKSSVIEAISGITLPRATGTCTRCPMECRLTHSDEPWKCIVSLHFTADAEVRIEAFGEPIMDKAEVEERIRRAQRAILNPSTPPPRFLVGHDVTNPELTFSANCVSLQISGQHVPDLSFCDLPGLIASTGSGGRSSDIELLKNLVMQYISKPSCIILLTVACETDFQNQGAHELVKAYDKDGTRTIGVITKPDRAPPGGEERWVNMVKNKEERLDNGWYCVKQPDSVAIAEGITWEKARDKEREFFVETDPWSQLDPQSRRNLGTSNLLECCSEVLSGLISRRLPDLRKELDGLLQTTEDNLAALPRAPSASDPLGEVYNLISDFSRKFSRFLDGTPEAGGLLQSIRPAQLEFRKAVYVTAPDFRPYEKTSPPTNVSNATKKGHFVAPDFLTSEENIVSPHADDDAIYIDEVMARAQQAITRELPNNYPFVVTELYVGQIIKHWKVPALELFEVVQETLLQKIKEFVRVYFQQYPELERKVAVIVSEHIFSRSQAALDCIAWYLETEQRPRTFNDHYYHDYHDKFFAHYKALRPHANNISLNEKLKAYNPSTASTSSTHGVSKIIAGFAELSVYGIDPRDLAKVLPSDPCEAALHIMASVSAYFQVAYKRFTDNVPIAIDHELVLGLDRDQAFEKVLRLQLDIHGPDGRARCSDYLREPKNISQQRDEFRRQKDRLDAAKRELMNIWI